MRISLKWLKKYASTTLAPEKIAEILTQTGLEVETIDTYKSVKGDLQGLIVGKVLTCKQHPNANKLKLTTVDIGEKTPLSIVCGAPNVAENQTVIVAIVGTILNPTNGKPFKIKKSKIRGEESKGMICAEDEIGIGENHDGIIVLSDEHIAGTTADKVLNIYQDTVFEIGITPNRTDALGHIGVARDLCAIIKQELDLPQSKKLNYSKTAKKEAVTVKVLDDNACPRFVGATVENITVQESPNWLKNCLSAIGIRPINNIVDLSNYVMMEWGIPLHVYDRENIDNNHLKVGFLPELTPFLALDEKTRKLSSEDIIIYCGDNRGMCLAGVFGGKDSGVSNSTKNIFIESAYWNPEYIRKTVARHKLKTDAAFRYERGADPNGCTKAIERFVTLLLELCKDATVIHAFDYYPKAIQPVTIKISWQWINTLIGEEIGKKTVLEILKHLDIKVLTNDNTNITVEVPTYRTDVTRDVDVIEEILRIYGFNSIPLSKYLGTSYIAPFPKKYNNQIRYEKTMQLSASGWCEISTNSLEHPKYSRFAHWLNTDNQVVILNAKSEDLSVLRQTMLFSGLSVIARNINYKQKNLRLFEFGKVYDKTGKHKYSDRNKLAFYLTGAKGENHWVGINNKCSIHDLKQEIYTHILSLVPKKKLTEVVDSTKEVIISTMYQYFIQVHLDGDTLCTLGEVQTRISQYFGIEQKVYYAEIDWNLVIKHLSTEKKYTPIPKYPEVTRDLSLVLPDNIRYQDIVALIRENSNNYLKNIQLFDKHQGKGLEKNQKSYALRFTLQDDEKTLNDKSINKTMNAFMKLFENKLGAIIRQ